MPHKNKTSKYPVDTTYNNAFYLTMIGFPHKVQNTRIDKQISIPS